MSASCEYRFHHAHRTDTRGVVIVPNHSHSIKFDALRCIQHRSRWHTSRRRHGCSAEELWTNERCVWKKNIAQRFVDGEANTFETMRGIDFFFFDVPRTGNWIDVCCVNNRRTRYAHFLHIVTRGRAMVFKIVANVLGRRLCRLDDGDSLHIGGIRSKRRFMLSERERECVSWVGIAHAHIESTRKRNNYINQFSKNKRMINYMKALDVIAAAAAAAVTSVGLETFATSSSRFHAHSIWYLRFLVWRSDRHRRRYQYFLCSLLTNSTVCCAACHTSNWLDSTPSQIQWKTANADHGHFRFY